MVPMEGKHCWMFAVEIAILFHGILLKNSICESSDEMCKQKDILFVIRKSQCDLSFPTKAVYRDNNGLKLFISMTGNDASDCHSASDSGYKIWTNENKVCIALNNETLSKQDIVVMMEPCQSFECRPSVLYSKKSGFLLNIHNCLNKGVNNFRISQKDLRPCTESSASNEEDFTAEEGYQCIIEVTTEGGGCGSSKPPEICCATAPTCASISTSTTNTVSSTNTENTVTSTNTENTVTSTNTENTVTSISTTNTVTSTGTENIVTSTNTENTVTSTGTSTSNPVTSISTENIVTSTSTSNPVSSISTSNPVTSISTTNPVTSTGTENPVISTNPENNDTRSNLEIAIDIMNDLLSLLGHHDTTRVTVGKVRGLITRLPLKDHADINVGFASGELTILNQKINLSMRFSQFSQSVHITKDASAMAVKRNSSAAGVLLIPGIHPAKDNPNGSFVGSMAVGIEMGAEISGLSPAVEIHFRNVDKNGKHASCRSWDGKGKEPKWITDGCQTNETSEGITCQCSHLTFFAILLSPSGNISASDFKSLTYITSVGCGLSMFFLAVGLFMHFLIRKGKASRATVILMNLFVAMFNLNLSFLVNELIADLGNFGACVLIAAVMHYTMLATFSWFFIQALHLYLNLWKRHTDIKHYMVKICIAGWVTPATVVISLLAAEKYDYLFIYTDDGNSAKMCWIPDAVVHQGVNIGYYVVVFIFTFIIFVVTVRHIVGLKPAAQKARDISSIKTNSFSILGLFLLLGLTWAFAFFSYGPMLTASYYIFTILNSFQGFFLFIYYYNSSKTVQEARGVSCSSVTTNTSVVRPYQ